MCRHYGISRPTLHKWWQRYQEPGEVGLATIQKELQKHGVSPLKRQRNKQRYKRYQRPTAGDRVQRDTVKIAKEIFQHTAIDDCSRFLVVAVYNKRTAPTSIAEFEWQSGADSANNSQ